MPSSPRRPSRLHTPDSPPQRAFTTGLLETAEEREEQAYRRGLADGEVQGRAAQEQEMNSELDEFRRNLSQALSDLVESHQDMLRDSRDSMVALAMEAAGRMLRRAVEQDEPLAVRALEQVLEAMPSARELEVRVHPDDVEAIRRDLAARIAERAIRLEEDPTLSRGGCIVVPLQKNNAGTIDATLETAEASIRDAAIEPGTVGS